MIADLNAYHAFINSLRVPNIAADFANLKMLGHVYIVEDAKDLVQIVRDVTRYGGSFRPEVRICEVTYKRIVRTIANKYPCRTCTSLFKGEVTGRKLKKRSTKQCTILVSKKTV